jgi:hypothetical protein
MNDANGGMGIPACRSTPRDAGRAGCPCPANHGLEARATSVPPLPSFLPAVLLWQAGACFAALREIFLRRPTLGSARFHARIAG